MTMRCSRCDIAHEETSRCPTELEFERGYRAGFYKGSKESLQLLSDERRAVTELEKHLSAAECGNVALRATLTTLTARLAEAEAERDVERNDRTAAEFEMLALRDRLSESEAEIKRLNQVLNNSLAGIEDAYSGGSEQAAKGGRNETATGP